MAKRREVNNMRERITNRPGVSIEMANGSVQAVLNLEGGRSITRKGNTVSAAYLAALQAIGVGRGLSVANMDVADNGKKVPILNVTFQKDRLLRTFARPVDTTMAEVSIDIVRRAAVCEW